MNSPLNTRLLLTTLITAALSTLAFAADLTAGEVRKIDKDAKKITIKHGEIKHLDMPPMTMVFQVKDAALLDKFKPSDKINFMVEKDAAGAFVVTDIRAGK
jgi:Cu(I)/Ag(I) efflux system periplasmic protein CusF